MNIVSCAAKAKATYLASQELRATQTCFLEAQDTTLLSLFTLKQNPEMISYHPHLSPNLSQSIRRARTLHLLKTKVRLVYPVK